MWYFDLCGAGSSVVHKMSPILCVMWDTLLCSVFTANPDRFDRLPSLQTCRIWSAVNQWWTRSPVRFWASSPWAAFVSARLSCWAWPSTARSCPAPVWRFVSTPRMAVDLPMKRVMLLLLNFPHSRHLSLRPPERQGTGLPAPSPMPRGVRMSACVSCFLSFLHLIVLLISELLRLWYSNVYYGDVKFVQLYSHKTAGPKNIELRWILLFAQCKQHENNGHIKH